MGFMDSLKAVGDYINAELPKTYESIFRTATDFQLENWWNKNQYNYDIDER